MGRTWVWILGLGVILGTPTGLLADQGSADSTRLTARDPDRPRAIDHSSFYYTRLTVHRVGSYAILPLFAAEYLVGNNILENANAGTRASSGMKSAHSVGAFAIGTIFAVNTVTGLWNFIDARQDPGAARRFTHLALMIASEAGFVYAASLAGDAGDGGSEGARHRNAALLSIGLTTAGTVMMWLWKD